MGFQLFRQSGTFPTQLANPDLKWKTTRQINAGLNVGLFTSRLALEINAYEKYTYDLLIQVPLAQGIGFASIFHNDALSRSTLEAGTHE